jgi:hypothetical protein
MKARFHKGQEIYRIHTNWSGKRTDTTYTYLLKITKEVVDGCGLKRLTLIGDSQTLYRQFSPDCINGYNLRPCKVFHETLEQAEIEAKEYMKFHNGMKTPVTTYYFELITEQA